MRENKFRAWDKINEFMGEVLQINFEEETVFCTTKFIDDSNKFSFEEVELMQYTGLKDKNGREIYEGDIVRRTEIGYTFVQEVKFQESSFGTGGYFFTPLSTKGKYDDGKSSFDFTREYEVLGNIYENPELLEVNKL